MRAKRIWLITGMIFGGLLIASPIFGMLTTIFGFTHAFTSISSSGIADPQQLSANMGTALISTTVGVALFPVGSYCSRFHSSFLIAFSDLIRHHCRRLDDVSSESGVVEIGAAA